MTLPDVVGGVALGDERLPARFWAKVCADPCGCWIWTGYKTLKQGATEEWHAYGRIGVAGRRPYVHRYLYERVVGPIPQGLQLDHVKARGCTSRLCVNPEHLEVVTNKVNSLRGNSFAAQNARKTHCLRGHEFSPENTRVYGVGEWRACRTCGREDQRRYRAEKKRSQFSQS